MKRDEDPVVTLLSIEDEPVQEEDEITKRYTREDLILLGLLPHPSES
jgi:hypothetical protein